jgi:hypothetical protein
MIVEINGGKSGFKEYLETGQKKGRELHRDQLDQRIPLSGDLNVFEVATSIHGGNGTQYDHVTLSFSENHVTDEMLQTAVNEFKDHALSAWPESERHRIAFYAEAHRPKILSYTNSETGEEHNRYTHIHIGIGRHNLATGDAIEPLGYLGIESDNLKYVDAWQESFNAKHGFSSPKDNPKNTPKNAIDILAGYTGMKPDVLGKFGERKAHLEIELMKKVVSEKIITWADFEGLLAKHGEVSKMHKGKFNECYRVKPFGEDKAMRLEGVFFQRQFIERSTEEKNSIISEKARVAYLEQMQPRKEPEYVAGILNEWQTIKAREHRYLHTGSADFRKYQAAFTTGLQEFDENARQRRLTLTTTLRAERTIAVAGLSGDERTAAVKQVVARATEARDTLKSELQKERRIIVGKQPIDVEKRLHLLNEIERKHNGIASTATTQNRKIAAARSRVPRMPVRNLDGIQSRSEMLLQRNASVDVRAEPAAAPDGPGLRQADAGERAGNKHTIAIHSTGPGKSGSGRAGTGSKGERILLTGQPSSVLARLQVDLREEYERAADNKEREAAIRKHLDCEQLLNSLSHTHGLNPQLYKVTTAKDGSPRIQCGSRSLSPSDFLTKELGLSWKEAAPILRRVYEHQIGNKRTKPLIVKSAPSQLWREFKAEQLVAKQALPQQLKAFDADTAQRRASLFAALKSEQAKALDGLSGADKKAERLLGKGRSAVTKAEFKDERRTARKSIQKIEANAWRLFLQARAQAGNEEALAALRKLDDEARAAPPQSITGTIYLDDENEKRRRRESAALILKTLVHSVELNGDITYRQNGVAVLRDEGRYLAVLDPNSEQAIAAALLLAREKFGTNLTLTGSAEFQRRVVAVAVAQGIPVRFIDPQLDAMRQQLVDDKYRTTRKPAPPKTQTKPLVDPHQVAPTPAKAVDIDSAPSKKSAKRAVAVEVQREAEPVEAVAVPEPQSVSAHDWLEKWAADEHKSIVTATPESGDATHTVAHVAKDGIVVNKGRTGAVYPVPTGIIMKVGDKVTVNNKGELLPRTPEQGDKKEVER